MWRPSSPEAYGALLRRRRCLPAAGYGPISSLTSSAARPGGRLLPGLHRPHPTAGGSSWPFWREAKRWSLSPEGAWGGRTQELALACRRGISGMENALIFSLGSDGTDGPTDASRHRDGQTQGKLAQGQA